MPRILEILVVVVCAQLVAIIILIPIFFCYFAGWCNIKTVFIANTMVMGLIAKNIREEATN
jgi:hypothetical protein